MASEKRALSFTWQGRRLVIDNGTLCMSAKDRPDDFEYGERGPGAAVAFSPATVADAEPRVDGSLLIRIDPGYWVLTADPDRFGDTARMTKLEEYKPT